MMKEILGVLMLLVLHGSYATERPYVEPAPPVVYKFAGSSYLEFREWSLAIKIPLTPYDEIIHNVEESIANFSTLVTDLNVLYSEDREKNPL